MVDPHAGPQWQSHPLPVVRPRIPWTRYGVFGSLMGALLLVMMIGFAALGRDSIDRTAGVGICAGILLFLILGGVRLYLISRFSSLRVEGQDLMAVNAFGFSRRFEAGGIAHILQANFEVSIRSSFVLRYFLFVDREGKTLFKLPTKWWARDGIDAIGRALGIPVSESGAILDGPGFRRAFPGSISWAVAHPRLASCLAGLAIFAAIIVTLVTLSVMQGVS